MGNKTRGDGSNCTGNSNNSRVWVWVFGSWILDLGIGRVGGGVWGLEYLSGGRDLCFFWVGLGWAGLGRV